MFPQTRPSSLQLIILLAAGVALLVAGVAFALPQPRAGVPEHAATTAEPAAANAGSAEPTAEVEVPASEPDPDPRPDQIRALLAGRPLAEYAEEMVAASDRHGIDWRYLPILSFLESGGGVAACGGNAWGYAACEVRFSDYLTGMETVAATIARYPYAGKSVATVLCIWQSGGGCSTEPAVAYAYLGAPYFDLLGDAIGLPAQLVSQPAPPTATASSTATPEATPSAATPAASGTPATATAPGSTPTPAAPSPTAAAGGGDAGAGGAGIGDRPGAGAG